jgi:hypothetical protein
MEYVVEMEVFQQRENNKNFVKKPEKAIEAKKVCLGGERRYLIEEMEGRQSGKGRFNLYYRDVNYKG